MTGEREMLAMLYVIESFASREQGASLVGTILHLVERGDYPGVDVHVDWPRFLNRTPEEIADLYGQRLEELEAEDRADALFVQRSTRTKAALARRKAQGLPVGRQPGATDKGKRRRSGYVARWEREREAQA